jgi:hypothetical protein
VTTPLSPKHVCGDSIVDVALKFSGVAAHSVSFRLKPVSLFAHRQNPPSISLGTFKERELYT